MRKLIRGMDISTLEEVERQGGVFYQDGKRGDLLEILKSCGVNTIRLRLWNHPFSPSGESYGAGGNDFSTLLRLSKRVKEAGMSLFLDFHYSDFWADPGKQFKPKAWEGLSLSELLKAVSSFTEQTLARLSREGITPDLVQVGNEITYGFLWPEGSTEHFSDMVKLLGAGLQSVKKVCPGARTMLHLDNGGNHELYRSWFDRYFALKGEDFDMIGLSYYPIWSGTLEELSHNLKELSLLYKKELLIAEVAMPWTNEDYGSFEGLSSTGRKGMAASRELCKKVPFDVSPKGQCEFMKAFLQTITDVPGDLCRGFCWWEPAWIPVPGSGWATRAALSYLHREGDAGGNEWANQTLFDYEGNALPCLKLMGSGVF